MASQQTALRFFEQLSGVGQRRFGFFRRFTLRPEVVVHARRAHHSWIKREGLAARLSVCAFFSITLSTILGGAMLVLPAVAAGLVLGVGCCWSFVRDNCQRLLSPANFCRIATLRFERDLLILSPQPNLMSEIEGGVRHRVLAAAMGSLGSAIVLAGRVAELTASFSWLHRLIVVLVWTTPVAVAVLLFNDRHVQQFHTCRLKRQLETMVTGANRELARTREIEVTVTAIEAVCHVLRATPPKEYRNALATFVAKNTASIVLSPSFVASFIRILEELARQDLSNLVNVVPLRERLHDQVLLTSMAIDHCRNPLLELQLEALVAQASGFSNLLPQRRWNHYRQSCAKAVEALVSLEDQASRRKEPAMVLPAGKDPYQVLGIDRSMPTPELRKLRTRLALLYHPDATEGFANSSKMAEINAAFDAVMSQRRAHS